MVEENNQQIHQIEWFWWIEFGEFEFYICCESFQNTLPWIETCLSIKNYCLGKLVSSLKTVFTEIPKINPAAFFCCWF